MVSVIMHEGMGGPHLFHIFVRSSDPEKPVTVLMAKADIISLEKWRRSHPDGFYLPRELTKFKLLSETEGIIAKHQARRIFGSDVTLGTAYLAQYRDDKKETRLLVGQYEDGKKAEESFAKFLARMGLGAGAASSLRRIEMADKDVYLLKKGGREHYYFRSAQQVVWLSPDASVAKESLMEVLKLFGTL